MIKNSILEKEYNKKRSILLIVGILSTIIVIVGISYSFYNYARSGDISHLRLGDMIFDVDYRQVVLEKAFPVYNDELETALDDMANVNLSINGKTGYSGGIEYRVSIVNVQNSIANKRIPIRLLMTVNGLGTENDDYFTTQGSTKDYKVLLNDSITSDEVVLVGFIPQSSQETEGIVNIKAYISADDVVITDTYSNDVTDDYGITDEEIDDRVVFTTSEWETLSNNPISFKIRLEAYEGTWITESSSLTDIIKMTASYNPGYIKSYSSSVINAGNPTYTTQDTVETNNNKQEVYYYTGSDAINHGNVLFGGFCWQIVRTTDNGGVRLIYNGPAENDQCSLNRGAHMGLIGTNDSASNLGYNNLYGESYDYDLTTGKFHLVNPENSTRMWSRDTHESFIGKYTCKNATGVNCNSVYYVGSASWTIADRATVTGYSIGNVNNYHLIGSSSFNAGYATFATLGYMYNKIYLANNGITSGAIYGKNVEYNNGNYLVIEDTAGVASSNVTIDSEHHYSCGTLDANDNPETTCEEVRYYYVSYSSQSKDYYYIKLTNGEKVEDAIKHMVNYKQAGDSVDENINVISSSIKDYLEIWYDKNLKDYERYLDTNAVYCNNRKVTNLGGWDKNSLLMNNWIKFKHNDQTSDLACENITDRFSKGNNMATIRNPIGLITSSEHSLMGDDYASAVTDTYWTLGAVAFTGDTPYDFYVDSSGARAQSITRAVRGVRAAITLKPGIEIDGGNGTPERPYKVAMISLQDVIENASNSSNYIKSYTATVINNGNPTFTTQDTVETNNNKQEVYYYTGSDAITNGNVLFAGYCWQIVRTTDNGGVRLIYNGIAENNQCLTSRENNTYVGILSTGNSTDTLSSAYLYGDSYDYDLTTGKFSLVNPESSTRTWTTASYESFMGKYTCKNTTGTNCDNVWYVGEYNCFNDSRVETTKYSVGNIDNYREIGSSAFSAGYTSVSNVGYMYNKIYNAKSGVTTGAIYGKNIEYNNGNYLVIETTSGVASSNTTIDEYHHYSCGTLDANDNPKTTCEVVRYYFSLYSDQYYYIELAGGETVEDALKKMINYKQEGDNVDADINVINSSVKDYLEIWYDKNLKAYEGYLDINAVYCNNRSISNLGGWDKDGGLYQYSKMLTFKNHTGLDLACANVTDRFSKENSKARLKNPIGMITEPERGLMGNTYATSNHRYLSFSPYGSIYTAYVDIIENSGAKGYININGSAGIRAAITLKDDVELIKGEGTVTSPYQIGPLVMRNAYHEITS